MKKLKLKDKSLSSNRKPIYQGGGSFSGGNYYGAEYLPFVQTPSNIQMPTYISKATFQQTPIQTPQLDLESVEKQLVGKGHTNDVNAYIQSKINAQQEVSNLIATYGSDAVNIPDFSRKVASLQVNPAELNELIVRKEMSKEYADQNKSNGGQSEWVTAADGSIFGRNNKTGQYGYFHRVDVAAGIATPITSSDAIKLNDVDKNLINDKELMSKVAQTWGGEKAFEHVNKNMDKLGKEQWLKATEQLGGVDKLGDFLLYGEVGSERGGSTNAKNISTLYKSFMDSMDQSALNYFKNQALDRVVNTKGRLDIEGSKDAVNKRANEYNQAVEQETRKLVWDYMQKALDVSSVSKDKVSYNDAYTKARSTGGGGPLDPRDVEFLHNFSTTGSLGEGIDPTIGDLVTTSRKEDVTTIPNSYRLFNPDGTYKTVNTLHYGIKLGETADRVMQKTDIGLYTVNGLPNIKFAGQPIKLEGDSFAFGSQASLIKHVGQQKDAYGRVIPDKYQSAASAITKVLVHEDQLKSQTGTVKGADGKFLRGKLLEEDMIGSGSELSSVGKMIPGITNIGNDEDAINRTLDNFQVTETQRKAILEATDRRSGNWYLMDVEVPIGYTTATELGQSKKPLTEAMGEQYFGTAQQSQSSGVTQAGMDNWASSLFGQ